MQNKYFYFIMAPFIFLCISCKKPLNSPTKTKELNSKVFVRYEPTQKYYTIYQDIISRGILENNARAAETTFKLPNNFSIVTKECGDINAYWDKIKKELIMCYELIDYTYQLEGGNLTGNRGKNILNFVFFHELAHALIDILNLPITGREEDAADQFATTLLLAKNDDNTLSAVDASLFFLSDSTQAGLERYWSEHSLDIQRFYNILCWAYGLNPTQTKFVVDGGQLPVERTLRCQEEYTQMSTAWERILSPHYHKP